MKAPDPERRFASGQCVIERGSRGRDLFIVRDGNVLLEWAEGEAPQLLSRGDLFGETAAILGRPYPYRVIAQDDATVLVLDPAALNRLCADSPEFSARLIRHLAEQVDAAAGAPLAELVAEAVGEVFDSEPSLEEIRPQIAASTRLFARALLKLAVGEDVPCAVKGKLVDLAEAAGLEVIEAYRCLQGLLDRRLIRLVDDQLSILEREELQALGSSGADA